MRNLPLPGERWDADLWRDVWSNVLSRHDRQAMRQMLRTGDTMELADVFELRVLTELGRRQRRRLAVTAMVAATASFVLSAVGQARLEAGQPGAVYIALALAALVLAGVAIAVRARRHVRSFGWMPFDVEPFAHDEINIDEF